jgi:transcriptional regulator with XRE-family HTH domain
MGNEEEESPGGAVDRLVGARIKARRTMLGLTQSELAERMGITYQQLHKYEQAINRISAGKLFLCAQALNAGIDYFFEEGDAESSAGRPRLALTFSRIFNEIGEDHLRLAVAEMTRALAQGEADTERGQKSGRDAGQIRGAGRDGGDPAQR